MRRRVLGACVHAVGVVIAFAGCSDSESAPSVVDAGASSSRRSTDAGRRVNPRLVAIDLAAINTREIAPGPEGQMRYGPIQPLDGAQVCVVQRREAFAFFEPFEPLEPPVCVQSEPGKVVHIDGVPANSDLIITVESDKLRPVVLTERTRDRDVGAPLWTLNYSLILRKDGALEPWLEEKPEPGEDPGLLVLGAAVYMDPATTPGRPGVFDSGDVTLIGTLAPGNVLTDQVSFELDPPGGGRTFTVSSEPRLRFLSLPEGATRIRFSTDNDRMECHSSGFISMLINGELTGLPAATDTLEVPVFAGYDHLVAVDCTCVPRAGDGELIDLPTCRYAPADDADAGR